MKVKELIELLQTQDPEMMVIYFDEMGPTEVSGAEKRGTYTGRRLPTDKPGVYNLESEWVVVIS